MKTMRTISAALLAAGMVLGTSAFAQQSTQTPTNLRPESAEGKTPGPVTWTPEQLITASVHDAWVMSGRNEATFFEIDGDEFGFELLCLHFGVALGDRYQAVLG